MNLNESIRNFTLPNLKTGMVFKQKFKYLKYEKKITLSN